MRRLPSSQSAEEVVYSHYHMLNAFEPPTAFDSINDQDQQCVICHSIIAELDGDQAIVQENYVHCAHCNSFCCHTCFQTYLSHKMSKEHFTPSLLICPGPCQRALSATSIALHMNPKDYMIYNGYTVPLTPSNTDIFTCPRPGCACPLKRSQLKRKVECPACKFTVCYNCGAKYHWWPFCHSDFDRCWAH
ncbi:hypothetical protein THRCLA_05801 [Thraustotheca clavata]|uniref:IBR domain-containing protein n=1 Tax=Thraustotheca clavata TaxID=74557 RepID=A0A1V9ZSI9_9STRA|nr:hypothetical protein THRCLA_05801 [Thraustotheca clavata]